MAWRNGNSVVNEESCSWRGVPVLVAGGTGFIGRALTAALARRGAQVTVAARSWNTVAPPSPAAFTPIDLTDAASATRVCENKHTVFMTAALDGNAEFKVRHAAEIIRANALITLNMLQGAHNSGVQRFVLVSSSEVYSSAVTGVLSDADPLSIISDLNSYALSKVFSEVAALKFVDQFGLSVVIARPANVYGPGDNASPERGRVIARWVAAASSGKPLEIWGTGDETRSYIYVEDLVEGLMLLAKRGPIGQPVNFAHPEPVRLGTLAEMILAIGRFTSAVVLTPPQNASCRSRVLDTSLASEVLGFTAPTSLEEGLRWTIGLPPEE